MIDLNIIGGIVMPDMNDDDATTEKIEEIEEEINAALNMIAYKHGLVFSGIELHAE